MTVIARASAFAVPARGITFEIVRTMYAQLSEVDGLLERIQAEYREMPGLSLTEAQACRVWQLEKAHCKAILETLVQANFLNRTRAGSYVRAR